MYFERSCLMVILTKVPSTTSQMYHKRAPLKARTVLLYIHVCCDLANRSLIYRLGTNLRSWQGLKSRVGVIYNVGLKVTSYIAYVTHV